MVSSIPRPALDAPIRSSVSEPLFNILELDVSEVAQYPTGIDDIYDRRINGMIIRNVFSPAELDSVVPQLFSDHPPIAGTLLNHAYVFGQALIVSPPDLKDYCQSAAEFRQGCQTLFRQARDFEGRVTEILKALAGHRPVDVPAAPNHQTYTPATIRLLQQGQYIAPHCGNQFLHGLPQYWHLSTLVELEDQLSCFVVLNAPESGGTLMLYDLEWADTQDGRYRGGAPVDAIIDSRRQMAMSLTAGDMILFDGGRIWHQVTPVCGQSPRITIGGFVALSNDHERVYYWS